MEGVVVTLNLELPGESLRNLKHLLMQCAQKVTCASLIIRPRSGIFRDSRTASWSAVSELNVRQGENS
jgi:hypothetical protein